MRTPMALVAAAIATTFCASLTVLPVPVAAEECGDFGCLDQQPTISAPIPVAGTVGDPVAAPPGGWTLSNPPPAVNTLATGDFDRDDVPNWRDNCLIVPNPAQASAVRPATAVDDPLAVEWKAQHPRAYYRINDELGEACSGWNGNWHRTEMSLRLAPEPVKQQIFTFLGEAGPMFGPDNLMYGGPVCTDINDGWVKMLQYLLFLPEAASPYVDGPEWNCSTGRNAVAFTDFVESHIWGGKRLFTPTNAGGTITNRFFPDVTENPAIDPLVKLLPSVFPNGHGQTVDGIVMRGRSYKDGRPAIVLDWRDGDVSGIPVASNSLFVESYLVYDECRAVQQGIWACTTNLDAVHKSLLFGYSDRQLFQFGWMMLQNINPDIADFNAWKSENPRWTTQRAYGYDTT